MYLCQWIRYFINWLNEIESEIANIKCECKCVTFVGDWKPTVTYSVELDGCTVSVSHGGKIYKCLKTNIGNNPQTSPTYWEEIGTFTVDGGVISPVEEK